MFIQITPESTVTYFEDLCESLGFDGKFVDVGLQNGEELGERLARSFDIVLSNNEGGAVVMGTDHPTLPDSVITVAIQSLDRCDVVLGPAEDGGYYLVGLNRPRPELFRDIPWSTSDVFESTLRRLTGEKVKVLPAWYDVDTPKDLERLLKELQESRDQSYTKKCLADLLPEKNHGQ